MSYEMILRFVESVERYSRHLSRIALTVNVERYVPLYNRFVLGIIQHIQSYVERLPDFERFAIEDRLITANHVAIRHIVGNHHLN